MKNIALMVAALALVGCSETKKKVAETEQTQSEQQQLSDNPMLINRVYQLDLEQYHLKGKVKKVTQMIYTADDDLYRSGVAAIIPQTPTGKEIATKVMKFSPEGRLTEELHENKQAENADEIYFYFYNAKGQLDYFKMENSRGYMYKQQFEYDAKGYPLTKTEDDSPVSHYQVQTTTKGIKLIEIDDDHDSQTIIYYDTLGKELRREYVSEGKITSYLDKTYDDNGYLVEEVSYDQLIDDTHEENISYTNDKRGNPIAIYRSLEGREIETYNFFNVYQYDSQGNEIKRLYLDKEGNKLIISQIEYYQ